MRTAIVVNNGRPIIVQAGTCRNMARRATVLGRSRRFRFLSPRIRKERVLRVRYKLTDGSYEVNGLLDQALDRLLEELLLGK